MNRGRVSAQVFLSFLMMMFLMVIGCSSSDNAAPAAGTTYTVTFDSQSATVAASPTSKTVVSPATTVGILPAAPTQSGYTFGGWYMAIDGGGTAFTASTPVTADITVYAKWNSDTTTVLTGKIVFIGSQDEAAHQRAVFVMNADGSNLTQLTNYSIGAQHPAWSPDGKKIAFASILDGGIYVMNADGTNLTRIVYKTVYDEYTDTWHIAANDHPSWSPNGSVIVYESYGDEDSGTILANVNIYVVNSDGTGKTRLTNDLSYEGQPSWSPDGSKIAFVFFRYESTNYGNYQILTMNADGSNWVQWTNSDITWNNQEPDWSPDGSKILFTGDGNDHQGIFCIDLGKATQTFVGANLGSHPKWSPDGTKFVTDGWYSEGNIIGMRIWITNADGSNTEKIDTPTDMSAREPDWTSQ